MDWTPKVREALGWLQPHTAYRFDRLWGPTRCRMWRHDLLRWTGYSDESGEALFYLTPEGELAAAEVQGEDGRGVRI